MKTFWLTLIIAGVLLLLCSLGLAIGYLITGKSKLSCRRCSKPEEDSCPCKKKK
ncbi:MAG: hypothetical protein P0S94_03905 [Simkaniaceae bacterium]|nr:hypothetical protein [Simkaniaceae bacterium]